MSNKQIYLFWNSEKAFARIGGSVGYVFEGSVNLGSTKTVTKFQRMKKVLIQLCYVT